MWRNMTITGDMEQEDARQSNTNTPFLHVDFLSFEDMLLQWFAWAFITLVLSSN